MTQWLWEYRKVWIAAGINFIFLQFIFFMPKNLFFWVLLLLAGMIGAVWWVSGFDKKISRWLPVFWEILWIVGGGIGFIIFNVVSVPGFVAISVLLAIILGYMLYLYNQYVRDQIWPIRALSTLDFFNLLSFFLFGAVILQGSEFYNLPLVLTMIAFTVQASLGIYMKFWRENITSQRKWLYAGVMAVILQESLWVISFWHRGVFLKAFLLSIIFYLFADLVMHYTKGVLTVKVALEYVGMVTLILAIILIIDGFIVLR